MKVVIFALPLLVSACAIAPERMAAESDLEVCRSYGTFRASGVWATSAASYETEVRKRGLITEEEWRLIADKKIQTGMSRCAMYAAFGKPDRENRTVGSGRERVQHVFNSGYRYIKTYYIYTENNRVTAWQD